MRSFVAACLVAAICGGWARGADEEPGPAPEDGRPVVTRGPSERDMKLLKREIDRWIAGKYVQVLRARRQQRWKAMQALCDEIIEIDPENLKITKLRAEAAQNILEHQRKLRAEGDKLRDEEILDELDDASAFPVEKAPAVRPRLPLREDRKKSAAMLKMEETLNQRISMNFIDVDLDYVLNTLFKTSGVNIIADQAVVEGKRLTLQVDDLPLKDLLKFIARNNTDLTYTVAENAVWITAADSPPLEARSYPLTRGLVSKIKFTSQRGGSSGGSRTGGRGGSIAGMAAGGGAAGGGQQGAQGGDESYLEDAISWIESWPDWPADGMTMLDRQTTTLFALTTPEMHQKIETMLDIMDTPPVQILIRTRFIEVIVDDQHDFGIDFPDVHTKEHELSFSAGSGTDLGVTSGEGGNVIFTGSHTDPRFQMVMRALEKNDRSKLLSAPQILALNNQIATIDVSKEFQYPTTYQAVQDTVTGANSTATAVTSYLPDGWVTDSAGFFLEVLPSVGRDLKTIILDLHPIVDEIDGGVDRFQTFDIITEAGAAGGNQTIPKPVKDKRELKTKLVINDGDYVVIGGLMRNTTQKVIRRVPILGYIPLIGLLFRSTSETVVKSNLIIVVQAEILNPEGRKYTDSAADRIRSGEVTPAGSEPALIGDAGTTSHRGRRWYSEYNDEVADLYEKSRKAGE